VLQTLTLEARRRGVLDHPRSRVMTAEVEAMLPVIDAKG
jgi:hypothetical protein